MSTSTVDRTGHLSDETLLFFLDGEASESEQFDTQRHLVDCAQCRLRKSGLEQTLADVVVELQPRRSSSLSADVGSHTLLKLRLRAAATGHDPWLTRLKTALSVRPTIYVYAGMVVVVLVASAMYGLRLAASPTDATMETAEGIPDRTLTPGAIRPVTLADICPLADEDLDPEVPASTQQVVFREYGIQSETLASSYQVDYLINPQLGGTDDIRNLWPEPYDSPVWNARVKDALESRLHQMVCNREIDLASAQREIATDWISAYKKYFHSPKPV